MLPQDRARFCALRPQHRSPHEQGSLRQVQRSIEKLASGVSSRDGLVFYLLHHLANRFVDLAHFIHCRWLVRRERNKLFNPSEFFAHIFDQGLSANSLMLLPRLSRFSLTPSAFASLMMSEPMFLTCWLSLASMAINPSAIKPPRLRAICARLRYVIGMGPRYWPDQSVLPGFSIA